MFDQLSWATRALVRGRLQSSSFSGFIALGTDGPRGRQTLRGDSCPGPSTPVVNQVSRGVRARGHVPVVSSRCPRQLRPGSEGPRGRPAFSVNSCWCLRAIVVDQISLVNRARV